MNFLSRPLLRNFFSRTKQYSKILGVPDTATEKQIKAKFLSLAKEYHPDSGKHKDATKFKQILEAYKYLTGPDRGTDQQSGSSSTASNNNARRTYYTSEQDYPSQSYTETDYAEKARQQQIERLRRESYSYFNQKKGSAYRPYGSDNSDKGYDSLWETMKAAPELFFVTFFLLFTVLQYHFSTRGLSGASSGPNTRIVYSVEEKVFETEEEEKRYVREMMRREMKKREESLNFNYRKRYDGQREEKEEDQARE